MQPQPQAAPPQTPGQPAGAQKPGVDPRMDPRLIAANKNIVKAAMRYVYTKEVTGHLMLMVKAAEDPVQGIAQATTTVIEQLAKQMKGMRPEFAYSAAPMVVAVIAQLGEAAGIVDDDEKIIPQVLQIVARGGQKQPPAQAPAPQDVPPQAAAPGAAIDTAMEV